MSKMLDHVKHDDSLYLCNFRVSVDGDWLCLKELQDLRDLEASAPRPLPPLQSDHNSAVATQQEQPQAAAAPLRHLLRPQVPKASAARKSFITTPEFEKLICYPDYPVGKGSLFVPMISFCLSLYYSYVYKIVISALQVGIPPPSRGLTW